MAVFFATLSLMSTPVFAETFEFTTTSQWETGTLSNIETQSSQDSIQIDAAGTWGSRTWKTPDTTFSLGAAYVSDGTDIYAFRGLGDILFWKYEPTKDEWTSLAVAPAGAYYGADLEYHDGYIYAIFGGYQRKFSRYSIANNTWESLPDVPEYVHEGGSIVTDGTNLYVLRGGNNPDFYKFELATQSWTTLSGTPANIRRGADLVYIDGVLYTPLGGNSTTFYKYTISSGSWSTLATAPATLYDNGDYTTDGTDIYVVRQNNTDSFYKYDVSGNSWSTLANTPAAMRYGGVVYLQDDGLLYVIRSNGTYDFWKYDQSTNTYLGYTESSTVFNNGSDLLFHSDYVYSPQGGGSTNFQRFNTAANTWESRASIPASINDNVKGVVAGDNIYYFRGGNTLTFYRYSISGNAWTQMADAPATVRFGGTLAYPGSGDYIYATRGNTQLSFWRYSISGDSWDDLGVADIPTDARASYGARLISDGTDVFYIAGIGLKQMFRYSISGDTWTELSAPPFASYYGTDVTYYNGKLYALAGWYETDLWEYTIATDSWRKMPSFGGLYAADIGTYAGASIESNGAGELFMTYGGGRNYFQSFSVSASNYFDSAVWTSPVQDLTYVASFDSISTIDSTPGNSAIVYQTRTSSDNSSWSSWQTISGSTIQSAPARYFQVRAVLAASSDKSASPSVESISISYSGDTTAPSNPSSVTGSSQEIGGAPLTSGQTYRHIHPVFSWTGASDEDTSVAGYYVYFGTNPSADPQVLGTYQTTTTYTVSQPLVTGTYYLRIKTVDVEDNVSATLQAFEYVYGGISPAQSVTSSTAGDFSGTASDTQVQNDQLKLVDESGGFWQEDLLSAAPGGMQYGAKNVGYVADSGKLYVFQGNNSPTFYEYEIATDTWSTLANAPGNVRMGGGVVEGPDGYLYGLQGNNSTSFWRYSIADNTWSDEGAADTPLTVYYGGSIVYDGSQYIYVSRGNNDDVFWRYDTQMDTWETLASIDFGASTGQAVNNYMYIGGNLTIDRSNGRIFAIAGNIRDNFSYYDIDTNSWTVLPGLPVLPYLGASIEYVPSSNSIYFTPGYNTEYLFEFNLDTEEWTRKADAPNLLYYGSTLKLVDGFLYTLRGNGTTSFYRYNISKDSWLIPNRNLFGTVYRNASYEFASSGSDLLKGDGSNFYVTQGNYSDKFIRWNSETGDVTRLANTPVGMMNGSSLVFNSTDNTIYLTGNPYSQKFFEYDIATNSWSELASDPPPAATNYGSSMVYDGSQYVYLNRGGNTSNVYRYDTLANEGARWSSLANPPQPLGYGAELALYNNYLYTMRGQNVSPNPFYRYDIAGTTWGTMSPLGIDVYNDGFLANGGNGSFYASKGENTQDFYEYRVADDTWTQLDNAPLRMSVGASGEGNGTNKVFVLAGNASTTHSYREGIYTYVMDTDSSGFVESGLYQSQTHDLSNVYKWASLAVVYTQPSNTDLSITTRSSDDGSTWTSWTAVSAEKQVGTTYNYKINSPAARYLQVAFALTSSDGVASPTVDSYTINYYSDTTAPSNPETVGFSAYSDSSPGDVLVSGTWYNHSTPYFDWPEAEATNGASDSSAGSGVAGYYVYFGPESDADPESDGVLQSDTEYTASGLTNGSTYYLRIKAVDDAGNVAVTTWEPFVYKYDSDVPTMPANLNADPSGYSSVDSFDFSWDTATASGAPVTSYCYKTGATSGDYASDRCISATSVSAVPSYRVGANTFSVRTLDAAGNYSPYATVQYYFVDSANAPAPPTNVTVTPSSNTTNSFAFSWNAPATGTFYGSASNLSYYYSINALPTAQSTTATSLKELNAGAYATLPGENVFYIATKDEAGNINYSNYASVTFTANTTAPGIPLNIDIADVSVKSTSSWKLALSWEAPSSGGTASTYAIYRSIDGENFTQVASSGGISYVDIGLTQQTYYYKVKACDSANNCGAFSDVVSLFPDGKFVVPADLIAEPVTSSVTTRKATVSWSTSRTCDSKIAYGTSSGEYFDEEVSNSEHVTSHTLNLTNLSPGTTYYYVAKWTDEDGNTGTSEEMTFETEPPPSTEEPEAVQIGLDNALIQFTSRNAARVRIYYGETSAFGGTEDVVTGTAEGTHTVQLTGLSDGTKYFYKINSFDAEGEEYEGEIHSFSTLPRPKIENIVINQVKGTARSTLLVTWESNTAISSIVTYYPLTAPSLARDEVNVELKNGKHQMVLYDLEPQMTYAILIKGKDAVGNEAVGTVQQVATAADTRPPQISELKVDSEIIGTGEEATAQLVVSYKTDEPATAQIEFGEGSGSTYSQKTQEDSTYTNNHLIVISELSPAKVYHLRSVSKDSYGNQAYSLDKVVITPKATENALDLVVNSLATTFGFLGK